MNDEHMYDDEEGTESEYTTSVAAECRSRVSAARDRRYCSMTMVLAHVVKSQEMVRASLDAEFRFTCYVDALNPQSTVADWLTSEWGTRSFCVVDHASVERWLKKALQESRRPEVECVVCLCPARTNTDYFHNLVLKQATQVRFIKGRLKMPGHTKQSPFPSCVVVFGEPPPPLTAGADTAVFSRPTDAASTHVPMDAVDGLDHHDHDHDHNDKK